MHLRPNHRPADLWLPVPSPAASHACLHASIAQAISRRTSEYHISATFRLMSRALQAGCIWLSSTNWRLLVLASFLLASKFEACPLTSVPSSTLPSPARLSLATMMRAWQDDTPLNLQDLAMFALATSANTSRRASSDAVSSDAAGVIRPGSHQMRRRQQKGAPRRKSIDILPNLYSGVGEEAPPAGRFMARNGERHPLRRSPKLQPLVEAQYRIFHYALKQAEC